MKIAILGAGAMGCLYGAAFHRAGADVVLIDVDQPHIDAINAQGLELETRAGTEYLQIPAQRPDQLDSPVDLVVVFTKTFQTDRALSGIAAAIGPNTQLLSLQNGLGNDRRLVEHAAPERVMVGASTMPSDLIGPGKVRSHGEGGSKLFPAFAGEADFAIHVADLLTKGGIPTTADPGIHHVIWSKAIFNAAMNPLCALTLRTPGFLFLHDESRDMIRTVVDEGVTVARATGVMIEAQPIHDLTLVSMTDHANHEASMLQDVKAGRRTEIDAINGAILDAAHAAGLSVPVTETLYRMVRLQDAKIST